MKVLITFLLFGLLFSPLNQSIAYADEEEETEEVENINEEDLQELSEEEIENLNEMEVVENVTDTGGVIDLPDGTRQFLTVVTPDGRTYYIIITYDAFGQTVNLLRDLNESDIEEMANAEATQNTDASSNDGLTSSDNSGDSNIESTNGEETTEEEEEGGVNLLLIGGVLAVVGVVGYFKIVKGKEDNTSY